ncbi:sugar transferase [Exiguobacterium sp. s157]|uniref:sugar transferase n=1 Tax=Exiguobacterium sp. s157 TaxID=2751233 RepID=UPI001BEC1D40|nr:sugar transferase [Exiguobacterium sp. s157]
MYFKFKRFLDCIFSFIGLIILSPVFIIIVILIKLESRGPVLFKQKRIGINKEEFDILKFRTMKITTPRDTPTHQLNNPGQYITKVGNFLRKTSLDELPQIWNILVGEMSFVGPRPALWNQYDLIEERDKYGVNNILPGLTGWAQVNGRDELPIYLKVRLDAEYVEKANAKMDIQCLLRTVVSVIKSEGIVEGSIVTKNEIASTKENKHNEI